MGGVPGDSVVLGPAAELPPPVVEVVGEEDDGDDQVDPIGEHEHVAGVDGEAVVDQVAQLEQGKRGYVLNIRLVEKKLASF